MGAWRHGSGLSYYDGYRGWHAPPQWMQADAVPMTNPKLMPSLLQGTGFQFEHGSAGALLHFHTSLGDQLRNVSRGEALDLSYAQQAHPPDHAARLAQMYCDFARAGARRLLVEGDASAIGSYAIAIGDDWEKEWGKVPEPDLYYGATLAAGSINPRFYLDHFRPCVAAGAPWTINWDFLFSRKLSGDDVESARREVREVLRDYKRVKDQMTHRFVHADGSGYTWTNDRDKIKVVWLLREGELPDGHKGEAGQLYLIEAK